MTRSPELREALQETFVTERGGRPVLAVKLSARGEVPGVVHASSSSGQTLFVEPFAIVELSNRLAEAESAEQEEVARILRDLSALVAAQAEALTALVEAVAELDLALARAGLSRRWRGAEVEPGDACGWSERGTRCSIRRRRCRSTSTSATCARSSSAARTRAARPWR